MSAVTYRRIAVALSCWALLQVATMVRAAFIGDSPFFAFKFFATGVFVIILGLLACGAFKASHRARAGRDRGGPVLPEEEPLGRHAGLSGAVLPPTRW